MSILAKYVIIIKDDLTGTTSTIMRSNVDGEFIVVTQDIEGQVDTLEVNEETILRYTPQLSKHHLRKL